MKEEENFVKVFKLVTGPGIECIRHIFDTLLPPATLNATLNNHKNTTIRDLKRKRRITSAQDALLFPPTGSNASSATFDLSLMVCLIRNLTTILPPTNGWDALPPPTETSMGDDIARIKFVRNLLAHTDRNVMTNSDFNTHWSCLYGAILRQGGTGLQIKCDDLKNLRLISDVEIQYFICQIDDLKRTVLEELKEEITEVKENVKDLKTDITNLSQNATGLQTDFKELKTQFSMQSILPTHIQEQFKRKIDEWRKEDEKFVNTAGSKHVMKCIEQNGCVSVIGNSGTGKTFTARHIALEMEKKGYIVIPVSKTQDLNYFEHDHKTLFVIDDLCGTFTLNERYLDDWKCELGKIESFLNDKCCKMIATCRLQVYQNVKFKSLSVFRKCTCNLSSSVFILTPDEINGFKDSYLTDEDGELPELNKDIDFYPLLFSLYKKNKTKDIKTFFCDPFDCYRKELDGLEDEGPGGRRKYCGLVLCVLFNNTLRENDLFVQTSQKKVAIDEVLLRCGAEHEPRKHICKEIEALQGSFVKKEDDTFKIIHDKLFDFLAKYFGNKMTAIFIEYSHHDFFKERFFWNGSSAENEDKEGIDVSYDYDKSIFISRFIRLWEEGNVINVFTNRNMKEVVFREKLIHSLDHLPLSKLDRLMTIQDTLTMDTPLHGISLNGDVTFAKKIVDRKCELQPENTDLKTPLQIACERGHFELVLLFLSFSINKNHRDKCGWAPLIAACCNNHPQIVEKLIDTKEVEIDIADNEERDSLYWSCNKGHIDIVRLLLQQSIDINKPTKDGWTPLRTACYNNHIKVVKQLLSDVKINVDASDYEGRSPLHWACKRGNIGVVRLLLDHSANINKQDEEGLTPLHISCIYKHSDVINELLEDDTIDVNACDRQGRTTLYIACTNNNVDVASQLVTRSANINIPNKIGWTPLYTAYKNNNLEVVKYILDSCQFDIHLCNKEIQKLLFTACKSDDVGIVNMLIQYSFNITEVDPNGLTPLHIACYNNHVHVVQVLLNSKKIDVYVGDVNDETAFHLACRKGNVDVVRLFLQHSVNVNIQDKEGFTPLHVACKNNHKEVVKELLLLKSGEVEVDVCDCEGRTSFYFACEGGNVELVTLLLEHSANINNRDKHGFTPLLISCENRHIHVINELLKNDKIDINTRDNNGRTALDIACEINDIELVEKLLKVGQFGIDKELQAQLLTECERGNANIVKFLLQYSLNIEKQDPSGITLLHIACYNNHVDVVTELLNSKTIDVDVCNVVGQTSLLLACWKGNVNVVRVLLQHSVNVNIQDKEGLTPLHVACIKCHIEVVEELLKSGEVEVDVRDYEGRTSFYFACEEGNVDLVTLLLEHSANINNPDKHGLTPLHVACYKNYVEVVHELLKSGQVDFDICDSENQSVLHFAFKKGYVELASLLLQIAFNVKKT